MHIKAEVVREKSKIESTIVLSEAVSHNKAAVAGRAVPSDFKT